jgi:hypothetical protein
MRRSAVLALLLVGCSPGDAPLPATDADTIHPSTTDDRLAPPPPYQKENLYIFNDRSEPGIERSYAILGDKVAVQIGVFPGYTHRKMYSCPAPTEPVLDEIRKWAARPDTRVRTTSLNHSEYSYRTIILAGQTDRSTTDLFNNDHAEVRAFLTMLRTHLIDEKNRVESLPDFIMSNPEARMFFGFFDEAK